MDESDDAILARLLLGPRLCNLCTGTKTNSYVSISGDKIHPPCYKCRGKGFTSKTSE